MMISLLQLGTAERVAEKSAHMFAIDPYGVTLTIVSVLLVFCVLLLLFLVYGISGEMFMRKRLRTLNLRMLDFRNRTEAEEVAAIAVALEKFIGGPDEDEAVAIAATLDMFIEENSVHDVESGIITIKRK